MTIHQDWRGKIHNTLRTKCRRLTGDYIQRNLDRFDLILPLLSQNVEMFMQRKDISRLVEDEWSESSIGKFLHYLQIADVVTVRMAGWRGLGITLRHDLTESPWKSRRKKNEITPTLTQPSKVKKDSTFDQQEKKTKEPPMPVSTPQHISHFDPPEDDDYCTSVDLDLALAALDTVAGNLLRVDLSFAKNHAGPEAKAIYAAQEKITTSVKQLSQIRSAIGVGDDTELKKIVENGIK